MDIDQQQNKIRGQLVSFLDLKPNWDSYGAVVPSAEAVLAAERDLSRCFDGIVPEAVPTVSGGVQLEVHQNNISFTVEYGSNGQIEGFHFETSADEPNRP